ncbi:MAG TPA: hypothetical protein VE954_20190 [Oligoflexus sp.]|uniref:hypothetical protein n=1 Tax=Oligoflexus sp. TaxID=1971216 RepID=UPI002D5327CA|nr:hypothetical protein [Oligoflexus sp.]HYX35423.1 hypothetical protein [Oligoflexus sp.]
MKQSNVFALAVVAFAVSSTNFHNIAHADDTSDPCHNTWTGNTSEALIVARCTQILDPRVLANSRYEGKVGTELCVSKDKDVDGVTLYKVGGKIKHNVGSQFGPFVRVREGQSESFSASTSALESHETINITQLSRDGWLGLGQQTESRASYNKASQTLEVFHKGVLSGNEFDADFAIKLSCMQSP